MQDDKCLWVLEGVDRIRRRADEAWLGAQVKAEAVAAAQERLEASKAALEQRREELLAKEAALKEAARAAEAATSAAATREERLKAREVATISPQTVQDCSNRRVSCGHSAFPSLFARQSFMEKFWRRPPRRSTMRSCGGRARLWRRSGSSWPCRRAQLPGAILRCTSCGSQLCAAESRAV